MSSFSVMQGRKVVEEFKKRGKVNIASKPPEKSELSTTSKVNLKSPVDEEEKSNSNEDSELRKLRDELIPPDSDEVTESGVNNEATTTANGFSLKSTATATSRALIEDIKNTNPETKEIPKEVNKIFYDTPSIQRNAVENVLRIEPDPEVEPLHIRAIRDTEGYIASKIDKIEDRTGVSVIPFDLLGLLPQVVYIKDHDIIKVRGKSYVTGTKRKVNETLLYAYADRIESSILSGVEFDDSLMVTCDFEGSRIETLKFNTKELSYLVSKFSEMNPSVYVTTSGEYRLNIGGNIGGF